MKKQLGFKFKTLVIAIAIMSGIAISPARADHGQSSIAPLAAFVMLDLYFQRNQERHYQYYDQHRHGKKYKKLKRSKWQHQSRRSRSYSQGGYSQPPKRIYRH